MANITNLHAHAIVLYFGDPETKGVKEDATACVQMAIAMQRRMRELQSEWRNLGLERPFELRIGINTGYCTVGNFGSEDRMDYTIIGGEVNLAARLEAFPEKPFPDPVSFPRGTPGTSMRSDELRENHPLLYYRALNRQSRNNPGSARLISSEL